MFPGMTDLSDRIAGLPGMDRLLPGLEGLPPTYLVGGAVRAHGPADTSCGCVLAKLVFIGRLKLSFDMITEGRHHDLMS